MKKASIFLTVMLLTFLSSFRAEGQDARKSYESFRKEALGRYSDFRSRILDHYADFLNGTWHEYESLKGEQRDTTPKPVVVPKVKPISPVKPKKEDLPEVAVPKPQKKDPVVVPPAPEEKPTEPSDSRLKDLTDSFSFYNILVRFPKAEFNISDRLSSTADYADQWRKLANSQAKELLPQIKAMISETGLNDYLTYELIKAYVDQRFSKVDPSSRVSLIHFFLANLGYDARIGLTRSEIPLLLMPFCQTVYGRNYLRLPGGKYYVFAPDGYDLANMLNEGIRTCNLPVNAPKGEKFNLVLGELNLPVKAKAFELKHGRINLVGEVNENLMAVLYNYPQMPISDYVESCPDPKLRASLVEQLKQQIGEMESDAAVEELLDFMHNAFEYATDDSYHGFEKPYFLEETLYYPKNDCEDRAIFYTYFLWNALGKEAQLVGFPGHEAATVMLDTPVDGTSYGFQGKTYYISDPTFIGSRTGMVMPNYIGISPTVDYTYTAKSD